MAAEVDPRKLENLRVVDLRNELTKRNLDSKGVKSELIERLRTALKEDGHDVETYLFDIESSDKKSATPRSKRRINESNADVELPGSELNQFVCIDGTDADKVHALEGAESMDDQHASSNGINDVVELKKVDVKNERKELEIGDMTRPDEKAVESTVDVLSATSVQKQKVICKSVKKDSSVARMESQETSSPTGDGEVKKSQVPAKEKTQTPAEAANAKKLNDPIDSTNGDDDVQCLGESHENKMKGVENSKNKEKEEKCETIKKIETSNDAPSTSSLVKVSATKNSDPAFTIAGGSRNLWVSGLNTTTRATDLKQLFSKYGKVVGAKIVTNAKTPGARCYGYVTMLLGQDATESMKKLNLTELHGRIICVERAKDDGTGPARKKGEIKICGQKKDPEDVTNGRRSRSVEIRKTSTKSLKRDKTEPSVKDKNTAQKFDLKSTKESTGSKNGTQRKRSRSRSAEAQRILTLEKIQMERERERVREKERLLRFEERKREVEKERQREIEKRQKEEAMRLEKEREKLKQEREQIDRERAELLRLERETQRAERERLAREMEDLREAQAKLDEVRRSASVTATKRPNEASRSFDYDRDTRPPPPKKRASTLERQHGHLSPVMPPPPPPPPPPRELVAVSTAIPKYQNGTEVDPSRTKKHHQPHQHPNQNKKEEHQRKEQPRSTKRQPPEYARRSESELSRKERIPPPPAHPSRDKWKDDSSKYSNATVDKPKSFRYPESSNKSSTRESGRYENRTSGGGASMKYGGSNMAPMRYSGSGTAPMQYGGSSMSPMDYGGSSTTAMKYGGSSTAPMQYGGSSTTPMKYGGSSTTPMKYGGSSTTPMKYGGSGGSSRTPAKYGSGSTAPPKHSDSTAYSRYGSSTEVPKYGGSSTGIKHSGHEIPSEVRASSRDNLPSWTPSSSDGEIIPQPPWMRDRSKDDSQPSWSSSSQDMQQPWTSPDGWIMAGGSASGSIPPTPVRIDADGRPIPGSSYPSMIPDTYGKRYCPYKRNNRKY